jgi:hypothetical protein
MGIERTREGAQRLIVPIRLSRGYRDAYGGSRKVRDEPGRSVGWSASACAAVYGGKMPVARSPTASSGRPKRVGSISSPTVYRPAGAKSMTRGGNGCTSVLIHHTEQGVKYVSHEDLRRSEPVSVIHCLMQPDLVG